MRRIDELRVLWSIKRYAWWGGVLSVDGTYFPIVDGEGQLDLVGEVDLSISTSDSGPRPPDSSTDPDLCERAEKLFKLLEAHREPEENVGVQDSAGTIPSHLEKAAADFSGRLRLTFATPFSKKYEKEISLSDLTPAQRQLADSIEGSLTRHCWQDLREKLSAPPAHERPAVLISYRRGHERFAEAVAHRLGREGIRPIWDKWESKAGDSIPGKVGEWLQQSMACVIVVTDDFQEGTWATEELEAALNKRATENYTVVPVRLDRCDVPELLKHVQYVDCSEKNEEEFESKMTEVINGIFGIELNPYA